MFPLQFILFLPSCLPAYLCIYFSIHPISVSIPLAVIIYLTIVGKEEFSFTIFGSPVGSNN